MIINNSTEALVEYLKGMQFSSVYVEENFPLPVEGTLRVKQADAAKYLLSAALVGNKVAGFFRTLPKIVVDRPLRGNCLFVSTELPVEFEIPVFFCRRPEQIADIFLKAMKVSTDTNMPVHVVIAANVMNNYIMDNIPTSNQDRVSPYISSNGLAPKWDIHNMQQKLISAHAFLQQSIPQSSMPERMAFEIPTEAFPDYIFPIDLPEQRAMFEGLSGITTSAENLNFFHKLIHVLHGLPIELNASLSLDFAGLKPYLCPGCPFVAIYSNMDLKSHLVFTSVRCEAVRNVYKLERIDFKDYLGMISRKLNMPTLFIGNLSEMQPVSGKLIENGLVMALNDTGEKSPFPAASHPSKFKSLRNSTFPYSCTNIKKYSRVKVNIKRCSCYKSAAEAACADSAHCPALFRQDGLMNVNTRLCTGCRSCVKYCTKKALS